MTGLQGQLQTAKNNTAARDRKLSQCQEDHTRLQQEAAIAKSKIAMMTADTAQTKEQVANQGLLIAGLKNKLEIKGKEVEAAKSVREALEAEVEWTKMQCVEKDAQLTAAVQSNASNQETIFDRGWTSRVW